MNSQKKREFTARITQANPTQLSVILYEIILEYIGEAKEGFQNGDRVQYRECLEHCRLGVCELLKSLHEGQPLTSNLRELYRFSLTQISKADAGNRVEPLVSVENIMSALHEAFLTISKEDRRGPVMENTQAVYAGLTYGKGVLNESLGNHGTNRGFRV